MRSPSPTRALPLVLSLALFALVLVTSINAGAGDLDLMQAFREGFDGSAAPIFWQIRVPRIIVALLTGGGLAAAGVLSQGIFRNPLAGPSILGTSGGANVCVVLLIFWTGANEHWLLQPALAFTGALLSTLLVLRLAQLEIMRGSERLLLLGFALNAIYGALTTFVLSLSLSEYGLSQSIMYWLLGGLSGKSWPHVYMALPGICLGLYLARRLAPSLNVLNLGEEIARSLSIDVVGVRRRGLIALSLLVGASVAVSGAIGFVGLVVPHATRLIMGADHKRLLPMSLLNGMTLVLGADTLARTVWAPRELQVGAILALIGAPVFVLLLLLQRQRGQT